MVKTSQRTPPLAERFATANRFTLPPVETLTTQPDPAAELANRMASDLWSRLPLARIADEAGHRSIEQIIRVSSASHSQIVTWHAELREFIDAMCVAAVEFRGGEESSTGFIQQLTREIVDRVTDDTPFPLPPRSFVDYKFGDLDPAVALDVAQRQLEQQCVDLANQFFAVLDELRLSNLVGSVKSTETTCRFTFYRRVAILDREQTRREDRYTVDPRYEDHWHKAEFIDTYDTANVEIQHRHAMHVHHVRNPVLRTANKTVHPLPQKYSQLLEACPEWIRPSLRVLEGELFREEQIEWDTLSETRPDEQLVSSRWERCPAIVFGDYVLAGWGESAIASEEGRMQQDQHEKTKADAHAIALRSQTHTFLLAGLAVAIVPFTVWATPVSISVAVIIALAAMFMASQVAHQEMIARDQLSTSRTLAHSLLIGCSVFAIQATLFAAFHFSLPALSLAVMFAVAAWIVFSVKARDGELEGFSVD